MIFVTVGTQLPFDRLVEAVDQWAGEHGDVAVFAQIGPSEFRPANMPFVRSISPVEFREKARACRVLVAHAGMGSILSALEFGKPIVLMPRSADLGEHRNDHQRATAARLRKTAGIFVALDAAELRDRLDRLDELAAGEARPARASDELLRAVADFVNG